MDAKTLRNGTLLRCYDNDTIELSMGVNFSNTGVIEPYFDLGMDNVINSSLKSLNRNYNLVKSRFSTPLTNNENPIKISIEYTCTIDGGEVPITQDITNMINLGSNRIPFLDIYTLDGVSLRNLVDGRVYEIVGNFKLIGHLKKLPQVQVPYLDLVVIQNPFYSNMSIIS